TSSALRTSRRKPFPSGPSTARSSPGSSSASARVPGPIGSIKNASSPRGAKQRLIGRGSTRPGASSMKNCPGPPRSSEPRVTRRSAYGPTHSTATMLRRSRLMSLLQRQRGLGARLRDRVDGRARDGERRDARNTCDDRGLADRVAVTASVPAVGRVDDEIDVAASYERHDRVALGDVPDVDPGERQGASGAVGRHEVEAEGGEAARDRHDRQLVVVADGEEGAPAGGQ